MLSSRRFYLSVFVLVISQCIGSFVQIWSGFSTGPQFGLTYGYFLDVLRVALSSRITMFCLPVMAALPYSTSFLEDLSGGYIRFCLPRTGRGPYIRRRLCVNALSGGIAACCSVLVTAFLFTLSFRPFELLPTVAVRQEETLLLRQQLVPFLVSKLYLFFLCGCFWATLGALVSTAGMSRFLAYLSPFILYYLLVICVERYFPHIYILNPQEWLDPQHLWPLGVFGLGLIIMGLWVVAMFLWAQLMARRLKDV